MCRLFPALFDNFRFLRRLSSIFVLFDMQYKVRLGSTKRYRLFRGGGGVKAIPRTALLLSKIVNFIGNKALFDNLAIFRKFLSREHSSS